MRPEWPVNIEEGRVDQPWDHFNPNDERQFQQVRLLGSGLQFVKRRSFIFTYFAGSSAKLVVVSIAWSLHIPETYLGNVKKIFAILISMK